MPIVAGIGGNSGNQTTTLIVRALAFGQIGASGARRLIAKELGIAVLTASCGAACSASRPGQLYRNRGRWGA
jgi:magnesium transporter